MRIRVWTYSEALGALPYIASVLRSLREHRLEANRQGLIARRLSERPGRPDRVTLLNQEHAAKEARREEEKFREAQEELQRLDVYCLDPVQGVALIPFVHDDQLAWFIYDLHDQKPLQFWRYQGDALQERRPIAEALKESDENRRVI
jgi:hypothetical protein